MSEQELAAQRIVEKHAWYAGGVGLVPIPYVDLAAISAVNVKMLRDLSAHYGVNFSDDLGKAIISSLLGGIVAGPVARGTLLRSALMAIPVIGASVSALSGSIFGAAATYAIGKVFMRHFASGGTLLDFQPEKVKQYVSDQYQKGKRFVTRRKPAPVAESA